MANNNSVMSGVEKPKRSKKNGMVKAYTSGQGNIAGNIGNALGVQNTVSAIHMNAN